MELTDVKYKESEIGVIPVDWEEKLLVDVCTISKERINPITETESYKCVELEHISQETGRLIGFSDTRDLKSQKTVFHKNDVLFGKLRPYLKKFLFADFDGVCTTEIWVLKPNNNIDSKWLYYLVQSNRVLEAANQSTGTKMPRAEWNTVGYTPIPLPPTKSEQTAIATALSDTDALIENLEKLIAKKRNIKQGVMQELLTGRKRLAGFNGSWKEKKLGDIGKTYGGLSGKSKKDFEDGKYPYIPFLNILNNPIIDCNFFDYVNLQTGEKQNKSYKGDLFFNGSSETPEEVGMCSVLMDDIPNLYLNSFCFGFRLFSEELSNGMFLSYYFRSKLGRKLIYSLAQGATRYNLSKTNFLKLVLRIPEPEEQAAIANVLVLIDREIQSLEQKLHKYQLIKRGMMQTLLTGKIRLV